MDGSADRTSGDPLLDELTGDGAASHPELGALLRRAAATRPAEPPADLLAAMAGEARSAAAGAAVRRHRPMLARTLGAKVAALAAVVTVGATGAAAANGALPDPAQDAIASAAERIGVDLPRSDDPAETDGGADVRSDDTGTRLDDDPAGSADDHGETVSTVARSGDETGRDHGESVSDAARDADGPGTPEGGSGEPATEEPPVTAPNHGDAATDAGSPADDAADGGQPAREPGTAPPATGGDRPEPPPRPDAGPSHDAGPNDDASAEAQPAPPQSPTHEPPPPRSEAGQNRPDGQ